MSTVIAIIPAYNEATRLSAAIADVLPHVNGVVVVDDCSQDETWSVAQATGVHVLRHALNRGQGAALQTGTDFALSVLGADYIVHFDADGQMLGSEVSSLLEPLVAGEADVVLGSRFLGKQAEHMPLVRKVFLKGGILFTMIVSGLWVTDAHNGFRVLSRHAASTMRITLDRAAHASEILDHIANHRLRYVERPVTIRYSAETLQKGQSNWRAFGVAKEVLKKKLLP